MTSAVPAKQTEPTIKRRFEAIVVVMLMLAVVSPLNSRHSSLNGNLISGTEGCGPYSWDAAGRPSGASSYLSGILPYSKIPMC